MDKFFLTYLILTFVLISEVFSGEFTRKTPEGALYNTRTHYYLNGKVFKNPELRGLRGDEQIEAYAKLGVNIGPLDPQKYLKATQRRKEELASRRALRINIAKENARNRRQIIQQRKTPPVIYVPVYTNYPPRYNQIIPCYNYGYFSHGSFHSNFIRGYHDH